MFQLRYDIGLGIEKAKRRRILKNHEIQVRLLLDFDPLSLKRAVIKA